MNSGESKITTRDWNVCCKRNAQTKVKWKEGKRVFFFFFFIKMSEHNLPIRGGQMKLKVNLVAC